MFSGRCPSKSLSERWRWIKEVTSTISGGSRPLNLLDHIPKYCKFSRREMSAGKVPLKRFSAMSMDVRVEIGSKVSKMDPSNLFMKRRIERNLRRLEMDLGMVPLNMLSPRLRNWRFRRFWILDCKLPASLLWSRAKSSSCVKLYISTGIPPTKLLFPKSKTFKDSSQPNSWGM